MDEIKEDIDVMMENNERPEIPESFVPPVPLTTEEIKEKTKQKDKNFIQTSLAFREKELRAADEIRMKKLRTSSKTLLIQRVVNQDINFSPNTTDNTHKLPLKAEKHLDEMVIDAIPKIEKYLYIDDDLDSFMFADYDSENNSNSMVIDVKLKDEPVKG